MPPGSKRNSVDHTRTPPLLSFLSLLSLDSEESALKSKRKPAADAIEPLNEKSLARIARLLARRDPDLAAIHRAWGAPPMWGREEGFATLLHIILEQQVSLASARAAFARLQEAAPVTPPHFLGFTDDDLKRFGFSRQKTRYGRLLAEALLAGEIDLSGLRHLPDEEVRARLTRLTGIGDWTADIYLLMALRRPDVWPAGDLALAVALQRVKGLSARPRPDDMKALAESWRPYRAVAARLLWQFYLNV